MPLPFEDIQHLLEIANKVKDDPSDENEQAFYEAFLEANAVDKRLQANNPLKLSIVEDKIVLDTDSSNRRFRRITFANEEISIILNVDADRHLLVAQISDDMHPQYWMKGQVELFRSDELVAFTKTDNKARFSIPIEQSGQFVLHIIYGDGTQLHLQEFVIK